MDTSHVTTTNGFALFQTAIGECGIAWRGERVVALALPESAGTMRARLRRAADGPEAPAPPGIARTCRRVSALLTGEHLDLGEVAIDHDAVPDFDRRAYAALRAIGPGETVTYGELARRIGEPNAAREVGAALGRNATPLIVPCHRVVAANGGLGGFSAPGGRETKRRLLEIEAVYVAPAATLFTI